MGSRAVGAASGAAGVSGEAGLAGVPRLLEDLARLSEDKDTADIVFLLGRDETPVYAHRIILQARSVFESLRAWSFPTSRIHLADAHIFDIFQSMKGNILNPRNSQ